jgi:TonB family protein
VRDEGPLILRREDDLTKVAKGRPDVIPEAGQQATPEPVPEAPEPVPARRASIDATPGSGGPLRLPPGGRDPSAGGAERDGQAPPSPSIGRSLQDLDRLIGARGTVGLESGTGKQTGPLHFDPKGADFTSWVNHFKNEVYRNWIVPQAAAIGFRGHVDLEFTVARDGSIVGDDVRMLKSSGTDSFDRAARNALLGSRFQSLPNDFGPDTVTMTVTFFYNEGPQGS